MHFIIIVIICRASEVSTKAENLVIAMLNPDPEKRLTVTQVRETVETIINAQADTRMDRAVPEISEPSENSPDFHYINGIRLDQFNNVSLEDDFFSIQKIH